MNDQQRCGDLRQQRQGAAAAIVIDRVAETVNARGDHIIKLANAPQLVQLRQIQRQGAWVVQQLAGGILLELAQQVALINA
ncbi:hypothetical protein D3C77_590820 [compost metagenome]